MSNSLFDKLAAFKDGLSETEQQAFGGMIALASQSVQEIAQEDLENVQGGASVPARLTLTSGVSSKTFLTNRIADLRGIAAKTVSSHLSLVEFNPTTLRTLL